MSFYDYSLKEVVYTTWLNFNNKLKYVGLASPQTDKVYCANTLTPFRLTSGNNDFGAAIELIHTRDLPRKNLIDYENCNSLTPWTLDLFGTGNVTQESFNGEEVIKLDSGANIGSYAWARKPLGVRAYGKKTEIEFRIFLEQTGFFVNNDYLTYSVALSTTLFFTVNIARDGVYLVYRNLSGAFSYINLGVPTLNNFYKYNFKIRHQTENLAECDFLINDIPIVENQLCSGWGVGYPNDSRNNFIAYGVTQRVIAYVDYIKSFTDVKSTRSSRVKEIHPVAFSNNTEYKIRFSWGTVDAATAIANGDYCDVIVKNNMSGASWVNIPKEVNMNQIQYSANGKIWAQVWNATNAATVDFLVGLIDY